ncbi:MAG: MAC/perforin domain-containing protein [Oscillospiraceae bacterium]|nr:MAC/perforin domain-containing protein [Oscillospiraceae bacterium]
MKRKALSFALVIALFAGLVPVGSIPATALDQTGIERYLFRGFNVLSGNELRIDALLRPNILAPNSDLAGHYRTDSNGDTYVEASSGKTIEDMAIAAGINLSVSTSVSGGVGSLFKASAKTKFNTSVSTAYKSSYDSHFFQSSIFTKTGQAYINDMEHPDTINAVQRQLDRNFLSELINEKNIERLFTRYGTHILTSYSVGGWAEFQTSTINTKENSDNDVKMKYETSVSFSGVGTSMDAAMDLGAYVNEKYNSENYRSFSSARIVGGSGGIPNFSDPNSVSSVYNTWLGTVPARPELLTDKNLVLTGIWELLPQGNEKRYMELVQEFVRLAQKSHLDFCKEFIYKAAASLHIEASVDDTSDVASYDPNTTIPIYTAQQFANIGDADLPANGNYMLMNDINLDEIKVSTTGYSSPYVLMSTGKEFNGTFDGNGFTISGYNNVKKANFTSFPTTVNVGLFPVIGENGHVRNLIVKGSTIIYEATNNRISSNVIYRAGTIAGLNKGVIENCHVSEESEVKIRVYRSSEARIYSGGIAGYNTGNIIGCSFTNSDNKYKSGDYTGNVLASAPGRGGTVWCYSGGIAGWSNGEIVDCYAETWTHSRGRGMSGVQTKVYLYSGGIAGLIDTGGVVLRSFADGDEKTTRNYSKEGELGTGKITGKNSAGSGALIDCFYKSGGGNAVGNGSSTGTTAVANFKVNAIVDILRPDKDDSNSTWIYDGNKDRPTHREPESGNSPYFIVEYINGKPEYFAGELMDTNKLANSMRVFFTPSKGVVKPVEITDAVQIRYDFAAEGNGFIQFLHRDGDSTYAGKLGFPVIERDLARGEDPTHINLNRSGITMKAGSSVRLRVALEPLLAKQDITWDSSNEDVVFVTPFGEVLAIEEGETVVTGTTVNGLTSTCHVVVSGRVMPNGIDYDIETVFVPGKVNGEIEMTSNSEKSDEPENTDDADDADDDTDDDPDDDTDDPDDPDDIDDIDDIDESNLPVFRINLTDETLIVPNDYVIAVYSVNGGGKWIVPKADTFNDVKFPKMLRKGMTMWLSDNKSNPEEGKLVKFDTVKSGLTVPKLVVNYEIASDPTGATLGDWVLAAKGGTAAVKNIQIGAANGKEVDDQGYGVFFDGEDSGISIAPLNNNGKAAKEAYFIRTAPHQESESVYVAAGKPKKISIKGEGKATKYKINAKKNSLKLKKGDLFFWGDPYDLGANPSADSSAQITPALESLLYITADKGSEISVENVSGQIVVWKAGTAKKPPTAKQIINR